MMRHRRPLKHYLEDDWLNKLRITMIEMNILDRFNVWTYKYIR